MRRKEQFWWVSATVLSLSAFSFFAGLGLRGLYERLTDGTDAAGNSLLNYPRLASAAPRAVPDPDLRPGMLYTEVLKKLQVYYVEPLPADTKLSLGSVDAMLNQLNDPNTRLLGKSEVEALRNAGQGEFSGLGAVLTIRRYNPKEAEEAAAIAADTKRTLPGKLTQPDKKDEDAPSPGIKTITVVSVAPGSPAEKAGLQAGDKITEVDGRWVAPTHVSYRVLTQLTEPLGPQDLRPRDPEDPVENRPPDPERVKARKEAEEARARWKNALELPVVMNNLVTEDSGERELTIERGKPAKVLKLKVTLGRTKAPVFSARKLDDGTGYVRIMAVNSDTARQLEETLRGFAQSGVKKLVVDLRQSAGGSIEAGRDMAGMLAGDVKFAVVRERDEDRKLAERPLLVKGATPALKPSAISVLVDGGTAGTSELLAAALRDHLGAKLVGSTTFGDGSEQELVTLDNGFGISITRARMLTSKGVEFEGKGLKADLPVQGDPVEAALRALNAAPRAAARPGA